MTFRYAIYLCAHIWLYHSDITMAIERVFYTFDSEPIDVVIPCHEKDKERLIMVINGIKENIQHNKIFVVSSTPLTDQAEWFDENKFPFSKKDIVMHMFDKAQDAERFWASHNASRVGWIYQQLIKLYASFVIPGISSNILIVDADAVFLKPVQFIGKSGAGIFTYASEYHPPYFEHAKKLINGFHRVNSAHSGVAHHMLFQRCVLSDLFDTIKIQHNTEPWKAICKCIDPRHVHPIGSCMSEYELYFNFALMRSNQFQVRSLRWTNARFHPTTIEHHKKLGFDYIACHSYL